MIRKALRRDIDAIADLGVEALRRNPAGAVNRPAIRKAASDILSSGGRHFLWVAEVEGKVEGSLGAMSLPFDFHLGRVCHVMQFYVRPAARGEGIKLLRRLNEWTGLQPAIRHTMISVELDLDPRIRLLLRRLGFEERQVEMTRKFR